MDYVSALINFDKRNFSYRKDDLSKNILSSINIYEWIIDINNFTTNYNVGSCQYGMKNCYVIIDKMAILAIDIMFISVNGKSGRPIKDKVIYARFHNACGEACKHNWYYKDYLYCISILRDACVKLEIPNLIESSMRYYIDEIDRDIEVITFA